MKNQKGITLVALVITIIVLLILAGVSISLVVGENGVLTKSTDAVLKNKGAAAKEALSLGIASLEIKYNSEWPTNSAVTRAGTYKPADLAVQGYTVTGATGESLIGAQQVLTLTKTDSATDQVRFTFTIDTSGKITWTKIEVSDGTTSGWQDVTASI